MMLIDTTRRSGWQGRLSRFAPLSPRANRTVVLLTAIAVAGITLWQFLLFPTDIGSWDWMLISGLLVFVVALANVGWVKAKFQRCIERLFDRGVLRPGQMSQETLLDAISTKAQRWSLFCAIGSSIAIGAGFGIALWLDFKAEQVLLALVEVVLAFIAGGYLGEMACFGRFGQAIRKGDVLLHLDPWHADKAAGIKPVGDFFFYQARFILIPAVFLAAWLLFLPLWPDYANWRIPYVGLLCLAIVAQVLAIFAPMVSFHAEMRAQKREWRRKLDEEFKRNFDQRDAFLDTAAIDDQADLENKLALLGKRHAEVEAMPTWPVDRKLWTKFTARNVFLVAPLCLDFMAGDGDWRSVLSIFGQMSG